MMLLPKKKKQKKLTICTSMVPTRNCRNWGDCQNGKTLSSLPHFELLNPFPRLLSVPPRPSVIRGQGWVLVRLRMFVPRNICPRKIVPTISKAMDDLHLSSSVRARMLLDCRSGNPKLLLLVLRLGLGLHTAAGIGGCIYHLVTAAYATTTPSPPPSPAFGCFCCCCCCY